jgi:hypothetical protein
MVPVHSRRLLSDFGAIGESVESFGIDVPIETPCRSRFCNSVSSYHVLAGVESSQFVIRAFWMRLDAVVAIDDDGERALDEG